MSVRREAVARHFPPWPPDSLPQVLISPRTISKYHPRKKSKEYIVSTKKALIGEHNLKPLLTVHKESIDW